MLIVSPCISCWLYSPVFSVWLNTTLSILVCKKNRNRLTRGGSTNPHTSPETFPYVGLHVLLNLAWGDIRSHKGQILHGRYLPINLNGGHFLNFRSTHFFCNILKSCRVQNLAATCAKNKLKWNRVLTQTFHHNPGIPFLTRTIEIHSGSIQVERMKRVSSLRLITQKVFDLQLWNFRSWILECFRACMQSFKAVAQKL